MVKSIVVLLLSLVLVLSVACTQTSPTTPASLQTPSPTTTAPAPSPKPVATSTPTPTPTVKPTAAFKFPDLLKISSYDVGSIGYQMLGALGEGLSKQAGIKMRVLPCGTDIARLVPVRSRDVHFGLLGAGAWFAYEGQVEYAELEWGPQNLRLVWFAPPGEDPQYALFTRADAGIKTVADIKGRKVALPVGSPTYFIGIGAQLAFANLTWNDVVKVDFPSHAAAFKGILEGTADVYQGAASHATAYEIAASRHGIYYLPFPPEDKEGWARVNVQAPYLYSTLGTAGAGLSKEKPAWSMHGSTYPNLACYASQDPELVYNVVKAIDEAYPLYKGASTQMLAWEFERFAKFTSWAYPLHDGVVRYLKEKGKWTNEHEAKQKSLLARTDTLAKAWEQALAEAADKKVPSNKFKDLWLQKRDAALKTLVK